MAEASRWVSSDVYAQLIAGMQHLDNAEVNELCQLSLAELGERFAAQAAALDQRQLALPSTAGGWLSKIYSFAVSLFVAEQSELAASDLRAKLQQLRRSRFVQSLDDWVAQSPRGERDVRVRLCNGLKRQMNDECWPENVAQLSWRGEAISTMPAAIVLMTQLQGVDLSYTQMEEFPEQLWELSQLECLILKGTGIAIIPIPQRPMQKLEALDLSGTELNELSEPVLSKLPKLQYLNLSKTPIARLPRNIQELSHLQVLDLRGCRAALQREEIDGLPQLEVQRSADFYGELPFEVNRADIQQHPLHVLKILYDFLDTLSADDVFKVHFQGESGDDTGGLRRELWTTLGHTLFSSNVSDNERLYAYGDAQGVGLLPYVRLGEPTHDTDLEAARMLGYVVGSGLQQQPALIFPAVMSHKFYQGLLLQLQNASAFEIIRQVLSPSVLDDLVECECTQHCSESLLVAASQIYDWQALELSSSSEQRAFLLNNLAPFKEMLVGINQGYLAFIQAFAEGLSTHRELTQSALNMSLDEFLPALIGELDRTRLAEQVHGAGEDAEITAWLRTWIASAPLDKLKKFALLISGSEVPRSDRPISVVRVRQEDGLRFVTCSQELRVPDVVLSQDMFVALLEESLTFDDWGFTEA